MPEDLEEKVVESEGGALGIARVIKGVNFAASTSEAIRLIKQGAVRFDGERLEDPKLELVPGTEGVLQVGKRRIARIRIQ